MLVWNRVWFLRELRECMNVFILSFQFQMSKKLGGGGGGGLAKKEKLMRIRNGFEEFLVCALI